MPCYIFKYIKNFTWSLAFRFRVKRFFFFFLSANDFSTGNFAPIKKQQKGFSFCILDVVGVSKYPFFLFIFPEIFLITAKNREYLRNDGFYVIFNFVIIQ